MVVTWARYLSQAILSVIDSVPGLFRLAKGAGETSGREWTGYAI